jgi:hypothetical protein
MAFRSWLNRAECRWRAARTSSTIGSLNMVMPPLVLPGCR